MAGSKFKFGGGRQSLEEFTPEERQQLRQSLGKNGYKRALEFTLEKQAK